jgi:hypothetical protein
MADEQLDETLVALYGKLQGQVKKRQSKRVIKTCDESMLLELSRGYRRDMLF